MTACPKSLPQSACDYANQLVAKASSAFGVAMPYDGGDVLTTVEQWRAQSNYLQSRPQDSVSQELVDLAADFWLHVGANNIPELRTLDPKVWSIPWQLVSKQAQDWNSAIISLLTNPVLGEGPLPPFDPLLMDWVALETGSALWSDPSVWPTTMSGVLAALPALQAFIRDGAKCRILLQPPDVVARIWTQYVASGYSPCAILDEIQSGVPAALTTALAPLPSAITVTPKATTSASPWLSVGLFVSAVAALGIIGYVVQQQRSHAMAHAVMRNPIRKRRRI